MAFPNLEIRSETFQILCSYALNNFNGFKNDIIFSRFYKLVIEWGRDFEDYFRFNEKYID